MSAKKLTTPLLLLIITLFGSMVYFGLSSPKIAYGSDVLTGRQGGTGIGTATVGDIGNCLKVLSNSPFSYQLGTCGGGGGTNTDKWATSTDGITIEPSGGNGILVRASSTLQSFTAQNSTTTNGTTTSFAIQGLTAHSLVASNGIGGLVSTSTIGNNQLQNSSVTVNTTAPLGGGGLLNLGGVLNLTCAGCLTSLSGAASSTLLADNNTFTGKNVFGIFGASSTALFAQGFTAYASSTLQSFTATNSTTTNSTSTNFFSTLGSFTNILRTGTSDGCATWASGLLTSTGLACASGSGGGNSKWATTSTDITPNVGQGIIVVASSTFGGNLFARGPFYASTTALFTNGFIAYASSTLQNFTAINSTSTSATTTNFAVTGLATTTFAGGINLNSGCFSLLGNCLGFGISAASPNFIYSTNTPGFNVPVNFTGASNTAPTFSAGTLKLPSNTAYFVVQMWGGGGGGTGGSGAGGTGYIGSSSCFAIGTTGCNSSNTLATSTGGLAGSFSGLAGAGGRGIGGDINLPGGPGGTMLGTTVSTGGAPGGNAAAGGGGGVGIWNAAGTAGTAPGGGGAGGGVTGSGSAVFTGVGGGGGGSFIKLISTISGTYSYTVGLGGPKATATPTTGFAGSDGAPGGFAVQVFTTPSTANAAVGVINSGSAGQFPYYSANGTTLSATSTLFLSTGDVAGHIGIGTTTPSGVHAASSSLAVAGNLFVSGTSTAAELRLTGAGLGNMGSTTPNSNTLYKENVPKVWLQYTSVTTTKISGAFGVSSLTDGGTGITTINFSNAFADTNYAAVATSGANGTCVFAVQSSLTTTAVTITGGSVVPANADCPNNGVVIFGRQN